ncbi:MAG TPA: Ig-like domain-containing protein, partial [Blastocatellia bacterium]
GKVGNTGGLMAALAPGSWLPALPDGTTMGMMPGSLQQRYVDLYQKFGEAWRVNDQTSLFDYAPGNSTSTFTDRSWPKRDAPCTIPNTPTARPLDVAVARRLCRGVTDKNMNADCIFDVRVTGEPGFAKLYLQKQRIRNGSTAITLDDTKNPTRSGERVTLTATVSRRSSHKEVTSGTVQFTLNGDNVGQPVRLDRNGSATWTTSGLKAGKHQVSARYIPARDSVFISSSSRLKVHTVRDDY